MRSQVKRLSLHQNGKVCGLVLAASSLVFVIPITLITLITSPPLSPDGTLPQFRFFPLVLPFFYVAAGYLMTIVGCAVYNFLFKYIGGWEFELSENGR